MLEPDTFDRIPKDMAWSIERSFFPSLIERHETFVAYVNRGYWIDIGTPEKYVQVHRDIMDGRYRAPPFADTPGRAWVSPQARVEEGVTLEGPCFVDAGSVVKTGASIGAYPSSADIATRRTRRRRASIIWPTRACVRTPSCAARFLAVIATSAAVPRSTMSCWATNRW